jgi:hypothetical protein
MHFWNKLSTGALMRLTILASLNLLLGRAVDGWDILLHPWFFLSVVTLNLGLYAVMVYTGTLNIALIGMMLGGLLATVGTLIYAGMDAGAFLDGSPFEEIGSVVKSLLDQGLKMSSVPSGPPGRSVLRSDQLALAGYLVVDVMGVIAIALGGLLGRHLGRRLQRRNLEAASHSP